MRVFITGGSGALGLEITKFFLNQKKNIILSHYNTIKPKIKNIKIVNSKNLLKNNFEILDSFKPDIIIHCASTGFKSEKLNKKLIYMINEKMTDDLFKYSISRNIKKFIFCSSASFYKLGKKFLNEKSQINIDSNISLYAKSKYSAESKLLMNSKIYRGNLIILRLFPFVSRFDRRKNIFYEVKKALDNDKKFYLKEPNKLVDYSVAKDIADCIFRICSINIQKKTLILNLGSGNKSLKLIDLLFLVFKRYKNISSKIYFDKNINNTIMVSTNKKLNKIIKYNWKSKSDLILEIRKYLYNKTKNV